MSDITKCSGAGCKRKNICKRFTAPSCEMQSYFTECPIQPKQKCEYFMSNGLSKEDVLKAKKRKISRGK
jgi:hypothetical protein